MSQTSSPAPTTPLSSTILEKLGWRYATKKFDSMKKISPPVWSVLEESLHLSPSSFGLQPWRFLVVQNPEVRKKLTTLSYNQPQVEECSHYVVFTTLMKMTEEHIEKYLATAVSINPALGSQSENRRTALVGTTVNGPLAEVSTTWSQRQAYIAMGFLLETAALLGVDSCPIEGLDPIGYDAVLGLEKTSYRTVSAVALGYRNPTDPNASLKKIRFPKEEVIQWI